MWCKWLACALWEREILGVQVPPSRPTKKEGSKLLIKLNTIQDVTDFTELMRTVEGEAIAAQANYRVDAKSILGIFSLDLMKPIDVNVNLKELERFQIK